MSKSQRRQQVKQMQRQKPQTETQSNKKMLEKILNIDQIHLVIQRI